MNYELFMTAALAEAQDALRADEGPQGAVAVLDEALVAGGHAHVRRTGDPTAHAVMVTLREAASRLGTTSLSGVTVFCVQEPCVMCVGALLACDVDGLVFAVPDRAAGAAGGAVQVADAAALRRRLTVVSGILGTDALELIAGAMPIVAPGVRGLRASH
ncbi:MAG TPA: nucleoside deaminase [Candidatus Sulfotelmatobacter sp.]|nr:nucleoside deaminase [Candidatus Sulfotelmatobacter sp.]